MQNFLPFFVLFSELDNRNSSGRKYENVHMKENNLQYENVFDANSKSSPVPDHISKDQPPTTKQTTNDSEAAEEKKEVSFLRFYG